MGFAFGMHIAHTHEEIKRKRDIFFEEKHRRTEKETQASVTKKWPKMKKSELQFL